MVNPRVAGTIKPGDGDPVHGTVNGYANYACRCFDCRRAHAEAKADLRRRRAGTLKPDDKRHGTLNGYTNFSCRCEACSHTHFIYNKQNRMQRR